MKYIRKEDGFRHQELYVLPPDIGGDDSLPLLIRNLMVCDAGYFPHAAGHQKIRRRGIEEGILLYCTGGEGFIRIEDGPTVFIKQNQAFYIPPRTVHIYGASDRDPWSIYWMHLKGELLDSYSSGLADHKGAVSLCPKTVEQISCMFGYILDTMKGGYSADIMMKSGQLAAAVFTSVLYGNRNFHRALSRSNMKYIDRIVYKMQQSLDEEVNLSLGDMASYLGLSAAHFSELFKKAKGYPPVDFYSRMKIQKACRLLEISSLDVQDIALMSCYNDRYYFSRHFKKIMGLSPTAYRRKVNQDT